jgi:hypothetical protein
MERFDDRRKYRLKKDLPGCPKGTEFFSPGPGFPYITANGEVPGDSLYASIPLDDGLFEDIGRMEEYTRGEMIQFAKACLHANTPDEKIGEVLNRLEGVGLMGRRFKKKNEKI